MTQQAETGEQEHLRQDMDLCNEENMSYLHHMHKRPTLMPVTGYAGEEAPDAPERVLQFFID